ncbi:MAG TPA: sigma-70 family RNA polymerase sigma factor [Phycisphaerae bacterium]|nr:sigma-70 family RNA polymerase sigma factor [Phycisphaerae bacterium]HDZ45170.1 sigma-70 family RNA polymerase sigma factor [Phycisphaerae bacterium]
MSKHSSDQADSKDTTRARPGERGSRQDSTDPEAWVDAHADALFRYALLKVRNSEAAEDLVQETFLAAMQSRESFRGASALRTWLIGILRHKIVDRLRRSARQRTMNGDVDDNLVDGWFDRKGRWITRPERWQMDPPRLLENREFWQIFQTCLEALPERIGEVFSLRVMTEIDSEEVCKLLDVSSTNLCVMLHRARARLRACLEANWFGSRPKESG